MSIFLPYPKSIQAFSSGNTLLYSNFSTPRTKLQPKLKLQFKQSKKFKARLAQVFAPFSYALSVATPVGHQIKRVVIITNLFRGGRTSKLSLQSMERHDEGLLHKYLDSIEDYAMTSGFI